MNLQRISLFEVRNRLEFLEDSLIFALFHRSKFAANLAIYPAMLDSLMADMEAVYARLGRYTSPDEHPFTASLPSASGGEYPKILAPNKINVNDTIKKYYTENIVGSITSAHTDENPGSCIVADVQILEILSQRIHLGKFVAEIKFQTNKEGYRVLIAQQDQEGIMQLLTDTAVEERLLARVAQKVQVFSSDFTFPLPNTIATNFSASGIAVTPDEHATPKAPPRYNVSPEFAGNLYKIFIIPLTKEVEVQYLLRRLDSNFESTFK